MTAALESALAGMAAISLDELVAQAALQTRVDRKYLLPRAELEDLLAGLPADALVLDEDGLRSFDYESVYFDTPDLDSYLAAARKRRRRYKIRTRCYLDSGDCFLEVKTRGGRSVTVKDRVPYDAEARDELTAEGLEHTDTILAEAGIDRPDAPLEPTLVTRYARSTVFLPAAGARATVDRDLEWITPAGTVLRTPELAIVESKSGSAPSPMDRLLWRHGHRPDGISKYGVGLAALRPDLPANKWSRVLRRHFTPA
ncbi:polyphosphate polymerase domain-containing protein [Naasia sp. SYSU D00057]|uniref:polyphosphate polymerase domain-containing protein n=1 Tax=Naasia sp. SYSU D00057 TaxID=2817380 RepID=UPI0027DBE562|nr:polyphosphate polymerase domain-containing protein [Naasia sp. SYSU D00057]